MTKRSQSVTKGVRDAAIFAALATGAETHQQIADRMGCSREHVSHVARDHRERIEAATESTMQAAIDGPARARQMAADATPRAVEVLLELMDGDTNGDGAIRIAAAKTLLDRGGVPVRTAIEATVAADPERLARLAAMLSE